MLQLLRGSAEASPTRVVGPLYLRDNGGRKDEIGEINFRSDVTPETRQPLRVSQLLGFELGPKGIDSGLLGVSKIRGFLRCPVLKMLAKNEG
jgi:hypothetical protein